LSFVIAFTLAAVATASTTPPLSHDELWQQLMKGNRTFIDGPHRFEDVVTSQKPAVTVLACADSRVAPELIFEQTLGEVFVLRGAGNVADTFTVASIEYAILHDFTKMIVVLGHQNCGAVKAALDATLEAPTPSLGELLERIRSSFPLATQWKADDPAGVRAATEANAKASAAQLLAKSKVIREAVASGKVRIVPAYYALETGEVRRLD
jgi:carbonic anhydrase